MNDKVDFDDYTSSYNTLLHGSTKFFASSEQYFAQYKVSLLPSLISHPVSSILEYGCGIGRNIRYLQKLYPSATVVGTDISEQSISVARTENPGVELHVEQPGLALGTFDLIFVAGVFHHIPVLERPLAMQLLATRLKQDGTLVVFEHNPFNPVTRRIVNTCPYDADAVLLRPSEFSGLFSCSGLQFCDKAYCLLIPPRLSRFIALERYFSWLPLGGQFFVTARHR